MRLSEKEKTSIRLLRVVTLVAITAMNLVVLVSATESIITGEDPKTISSYLPAMVFSVIVSWLLWRYSSDVLNERPIRWLTLYVWAGVVAVLLSFFVAPASLIATIILTVLTIRGPTDPVSILIALTFFVASGTMLAITYFSMHNQKRRANGSSAGQPTEEPPQPTQ